MVGNIDRLLHYGPDWWSAVGTLFNAVIVFILALLNVLYLLIAKRQAKAAEKQTEEIKDQIALSREQLYVMQDALRLSVSQENIARRSNITMAIGELRKVEAVLRTLTQSLAQPSTGLGDISEDSIVPRDWNTIARCIERELGKSDHLDRLLHTSLLETQSQVRGFKERRRSAMSHIALVELRGVLVNRVEGTLETLSDVSEELQEVLSSLRLEHGDTTRASEVN